MSVGFSVGTRIHSRTGALATTADVLDTLGVSRVVVVADRGLAELDLLAPILEAAGVADVVVETVLADVNPSPMQVEAAAAEARDAKAEAVLAIGGGSALSAAKAVALLITNHVGASSLEGVNRAEHPPAPTVAIPTTAGSGSEVSNALVLHEAGKVREIVIRGDGYEPAAAILDAVVLRGLPREPLIFAALDALTHALESLWSNGRSMFTDACALHAAARIIDALPEAVAGQADGRNLRGENDEVLQRLLDAASLANIACGNSGLALVHALSSSPAVEVSHGLQNGILLPHIASFNRQVLSDDGKKLVDQLAGLYSSIGFEARFIAEQADAEAMIEASRGHVFRNNNARDASDEDLRKLLHLAGVAVSSPDDDLIAR